MARTPGATRQRVPRFAGLLSRIAREGMRATQCVGTPRGYPGERG